MTGQERFRSDMDLWLFPRADLGVVPIGRKCSGPVLVEQACVSDDTSIIFISGGDGCLIEIDLVGMRRLMPLRLVPSDEFWEMDSSANGTKVREELTAWMVSSPFENQLRLEVATAHETARDVRPLVMQVADLLDGEYLLDARREALPYTREESVGELSIIFDPDAGPGVQTVYVSLGANGGLASIVLDDAKRVIALNLDGVAAG